MRILAIADTHCKNSAQVENLIDLLRPFAEDAEMILHAGDLVVSELAEALGEMAPTYAVRGNMDVTEDAGRFPAWRIVDAGGFRIGLIHGSGPPFGLIERVRDQFSNEGVSAIVFGHTHEAFLQSVDGVLMVNPGSPTDRRFTDHNSFAIMTVADAVAAEIVDL